MFESFKRSFQLVKESMYVLRQDKELLLFPIISGIMLVLVFLSFVIPLSNLGFDNLNNYEAIGLLFAFYFVAYFIIIFFNTALISCAKIRFSGKNPRLSDGFEAGFKNIGKILGWTVIAATVGLILRILTRQAEQEEGIGGLVARIFVGMIGMAWSLLTFFVIPVMVFEKKGVFASIKRSGQLLKTTWGENMVATGSIGLAFFVLWLVGLAPLLVMVFLLNASTTAILVYGAIFLVYWLVLTVIQTSLSGIFVAALYEYAIDGKMPNAYKGEAKHYFEKRR